MFNLEKRERLIIIFLLTAILAGLSLKACEKHNRTVDVQIKSFDYEPSCAAPLKININEADEAMLMELPGVGKSLACRIIEYRKRRGRFSSIEDIKNVKGIKNVVVQCFKRR